MSWIKKLFTDFETVIDSAFLNGLQDQIITDETTLGNKVDKATGKGLSTNDYTTAEKQKLAGIETGAQVNPGVATTSTNGLMSAADKTALNGKPNIDLGITGASVGNFAKIKTVDGNGKPTSWEFGTGGGGGGGGTSDYADLTNKPSIENITLTGNKTASDLGLAKASDIPSVPVQSVNGKTGAVSLTASDVGAGTYSKPSGGIPKTDLTSAVQTSLGKADTALQSVPSTYRTAADQDIIDSSKLNTNQGSANAGKYMAVGNDGNITPVTPGGMSLPTVYVDNTTSTASGSSAVFIEKTYTVSGNGVIIAFAGIYSDSTNAYGTWEAQIYHNNILIMGEGTRFAANIERPMGASTSAPISVQNGDTIKVSVQNTKEGTKTIYRRFLCFGCTVS